MSKSEVPRWRRIVGTILLVVGCVLVPVSLSAVWVRNTLLDTDNYVSTVGPLASEPQVQHAVANRITDALFNNVDVEKKISDALPPRAGFLAAPVANGVQTAVNGAALRLAESDRFQTLWEKANRRAHAAVVKVLTGGGSRVSTENGTVAINTAQIVDNVKAKLDARGITIFDDVNPPSATSSSCCSSPRISRRSKGWSTCSRPSRGCCRSSRWRASPARSVSRGIGAEPFSAVRSASPSRSRSSSCS